MNWSQHLRSELRQRAAEWSAAVGAEFYHSLGSPPTVLYPRTGDSHGNFFAEVWSALSSDTSWSSRLTKAHSQRKALPPEHRETACELDSSNSSDALLMNCFCYPQASARLAAVLGASPNDATPQFGVPGEVRLRNGRVDTTELDMVLGDTIVEAKLTEADFTAAERGHVLRYENVDAVFDLDLIPRDDKYFKNFQLIRNVLAADQRGQRLVVLIDLRRPDLLQSWWQVHAAIRSADLRVRCFVRFWQELAARADAHHRKQLALKYGL